MRPRLLMAAALLTAAIFSASTATAQLALPTDFVEEMVFHGLDQPTGMALLKDGRILVVEKVSARIRLIVNGAVSALDPLVTVPGVESVMLEEGLLGIAVDPGWPARPYIYVHYNYSGLPNLRISRYTVGGDLTFTANGSLTIDAATRYDILTDLPDATPYHNGGALRFGADGMLYISLGDDDNGCQAQDLTILAGKILRIDVSRLPAGGGGPPAKTLITPITGNPFATHPNPNARLVYHWGMRNPFRFAIDPQTGAMLIGDVGEDTREELDYVTVPGSNLQWPIYEGEIPGPLTCTGVDSSALWTPPIYTYSHDEGASVVPGVIYRRPGSTSQPFPPEYEGDVFYCDVYSSWIRRLKKVGGQWITVAAPGQPNETDWAVEQDGAIVATDWLRAPDGSLYICRLASLFTQGPGEIVRIRYTGVVSVPPSTRGGIAFDAPFPSPARDGTTFQFTVPAEAEVTLAIYDLRGRVVRTLVARERQTVGSHRVPWDGRDASGRLAPPGVYFARLAVLGQVLERRLARID